MLPPRTLAVLGPVLGVVVTLAVREAPAGIAPSAAALPPGALIVALNGNDANPGTLAQPLATIQKAVNVVPLGGTIAIRGGTYALTTNIQIKRSGSATSPITMTSYPGERVIIDGEQLPGTPAPLGGSIPRAERGAIHQEASWWRIIGLEIINGPYGVYCDGCNNNVWERLVTHDNYETGFQLQGASSNNLILNLDSFGNRDPRKNGESADGLGIKEGSGTGNVVRGARLWNNVDDGFDAWKFLSPIRIEDSMAWGNGFNRWNFPSFSGDGNGFKLGGGDPDPPANHVVRNSMSFSNAQRGFIDNGNPGSLTIDRSTAYHNGGTGFDFAASTSTLTGNLAVGNARPVSLGSSTASGNSWNIGGTWNDAALESIDPSVVTGPRTTTGSIPVSNFLQPRNGVSIGARL
jgi:Right handed beta helix region